MALRVDAARIRGEWIRHAPHGSDPRGRSVEAGDGPWQRGDVVRGLSLADEPGTAVPSGTGCWRSSACLPVIGFRTITTSGVSTWTSPTLRTAERLSGEVDEAPAPPRGMTT